MTKRMLIDASHAEETRVVVLDGNRLEDFDVETSTKRQLKGNIYLAKVVRVEPSLQAAFVEYGGNRHGFLAFSEIHPDYYQIPIADRQRLLEMEAEEARREEEEADLEAALGDADRESDDDASSDGGRARGRDDAPGLIDGRPDDAAPFGQTADSGTGAAEPTDAQQSGHAPAQPLTIEPESLSGPVEALEAGSGLPASSALSAPADEEPGSFTNLAAGTDFAAGAPDAGTDAGVAASGHGPDADMPPIMADPVPVAGEPPATADDADRSDSDEDGDEESAEDTDQPNGRSARRARHDEQDGADPAHDAPPPETMGGDTDGGEDRGERRIPPRFLRNYKIQEVIRRRQIMLVQVVKEERGTKGAALTTYLSLAGRFSVLMPNSPRGGGISRKITSATDRRRLKEVMTELEIPRGMGLIVRTAGANRPKPEIKRDCEYLLRLWDDIREHTLKSVAPALIYEEASLIKRAIRDVYSRDIDEIQVDGEDGWRAAHDFMRMLMPSHAKKVQFWRDGGQPLFARYQVESQLDGMLQPTVQLRSGGYLVINQTEALVAIDVNSGRSTRERNVEETALRTNLEAAEEAARQLRLRDLAGLIVIDFIDMESKKHNAMVERRLKEALKNDRARIQIGHISHFGLLEMSRQRLRPSLAETSFIPCVHCGGTGHVRSTESAAIHVLRGVEDEGGKRRAAEIVVHVATPIALYLLNHKRERLREIEARYAMRVIIAADESQLASQFRIDRVKPQIAGELLPVITPDAPQPALPPPAAAVAEAESDEDETEDEEGDRDEARAEGEPGREETAEESERRRKRRRRRRRGGRRDETGAADDAQGDGADESAIAAEERADAPLADAAAAGEMRPETEGDTAWASGEARDETPRGHDASPHAGAAEAAVSDATVSETHVEGVPEHADGGAADDEARNRRRGRRGGRRRRRDADEAGLPAVAELGAEQPDIAPAYAGPTPANPFGGQAFDIFDVLEQAEQQAARRPARTVIPVVEAPAPEPTGFEREAAAGGAPARDEPGAQADRDAHAADIVNPGATEPMPEAAAPPREAESLAGAQTPVEGAPSGSAGSVAEPEMPPASVGDAVAAGEAAVPAADAGEPSRASADIAPGDAIAPAATPPVGEPGSVSPAETVPDEATPHASDAAHSVGAEATDPQAGHPAGAEPAAASPATAEPVAPEPAAMEPAATEPASAEPAAANDAAEPLVKPIVVGGPEAPPVEKKRGWWRR